MDTQTEVRKHKSPVRATVPMRPIMEQAQRLGLSAKQASEALGITDSSWYQLCKAGVASKTLGLAMEALVRRQSRDATGWALLKLNHGSAEVTPIAEPQEIRLQGKDYWLVEKPGAR